MGGGEEQGAVDRKKPQLIRSRNSTVHGLASALVSAHGDVQLMRARDTTTHEHESASVSEGGDVQLGRSQDSRAREAESVPVSLMRSNGSTAPDAAPFETQAMEGQAWYYHRVVTPIWEVWNNARWNDWANMFQLYVLASASAAAGVGELQAEAQADLYSAQLSNWVLPSVSYSYFKAKADYAGNWEEGEHEFHVGGASNAMGTIFNKMFQFKDMDGDGEFTAEKDEVIDEYPFAKKGTFLPWPYPSAKWDFGEKDSAGKWAKIKTADGAFSLTMKANENTWTTEGGTKLTPMNVKIDIEISYPNFQAGNLVALEAFVVSTQAAANASASVSFAKGVYVPQPEGVSHAKVLSFAWDGEATLEGDAKNGVTVKSSASAAALADILDNHTVQTLGVNATASANASLAPLNIQRVAFTFNTAHAGKIMWDPSVGMANPDFDFQNSANCKGHLIFALVAAVLANVVVAGSVSLPA